MAWAPVGALGQGNSIVAGTTVALTTGAVAEVGNAILVVVATDNQASADGNTSEVASVTDSAGNVYTKLREFCNAQGAADAGATVSVWGTRVTVELASGGTITATLANSKTSKAITAHEYTVGNTFSVAGSAERADDNADVGSLAIAGLASAARLFLRGSAIEQRQAVEWTPTASHTVITQAIADTGTANTSMIARGEFRILTGTGDTSDPTNVGTIDSASVFLALAEDQVVTLGLISNLGVVFAPTIQGDQTVTLGLISNLGVVFAPTVVPDQIVDLGLISNLGVVFAPTVVVDQQVDLGLIANLGVVFEPTVLLEQTVTLGLISNLGVVFAPTIVADQQVTLGLISNLGQVFAFGVERDPLARRRKKGRLIPGVAWSIGGVPVAIADDWTCNDSANLGDDQFRGRIAARDAKRLSDEIRQGSAIIGKTFTGGVVFEGRLTRDPKIMQDGQAIVVAQGEGHSAAKYGKRLPIRVRGVGAWSVASNTPLNMPTDSSIPVTLEYETNNLSGGSVTEVPANNVVGFHAIGTRFSVGIWSPGSRFTRITGQGAGNVNAGDSLVICSADGPNVAGTLRDEHVIRTGSSSDLFDVVLTNPGDAVIFDYRADNVADFSVGIAGQLGDLVLYGDDAQDHVYAGDIARVIGDRLGWDTSRIRQVGGAEIVEYDRAAGAMSALEELAGFDGYRWRYRPSVGLEFGPYERRWDVLGSRGAVWDLEPLERYSRAVVQYLTEIGDLAQLELVSQDPELAEIANELVLDISGLQPGPNLPQQAAWRALQVGMLSRWQGRIETAHAFDARTGRDAVLEVRGGDLVHLGDHSIYGGLLLPIADAQRSGRGASFGINAPALPIGILSAFAGGSNIGGGETGSAGRGAGGSLAGSRGGGSGYLPPGAPGTLGPKPNPVTSTRPIWGPGGPVGPRI